MSESEVTRLMKKVDEISEQNTNVLVNLAKINEKLEGYPALKKSVEDIDKRVSLQEKKCETVQAGKTRVPWGSVIGSVVGFVVGGTIMALISKFL